jgi:hypothetical protein
MLGSEWIDLCLIVALALVENLIRNLNNRVTKLEKQNDESNR